VVSVNRANKTKAMLLQVQWWEYSHIAEQVKNLNGENKVHMGTIYLNLTCSAGEVVKIEAFSLDGQLILWGDEIDCDFESLNRLIRRRYEQE